MKDGFNLKDLFSSHDKKVDGIDLAWYSYIGDQISLSIFTISICMVGLVGNGNVIWLLGFRIKRKSLATYILNLAVADFGSLLFLLSVNILFNPPYLDAYFVFPGYVAVVLMILFSLMYGSCQLHLTAIGIDRCVSVLFPNWYQCHRSTGFSTRVCALMWAVSFVLSGVFFIVFVNGFSPYYGTIITIVYLGSVSICLLLVALSALTLFIKVCFQSQQCQCGNLSKVILLLLFSFLLFTILIFASVFMGMQKAYSVFLASLKSSVNALIYFLVGRQNDGKFQEKMKVILQRVFKEERDIRMEPQPHIETPL